MRERLVLLLGLNFASSFSKKIKNPTFYSSTFFSSSSFFHINPRKFFASSTTTTPRQLHRFLPPSWPPLFSSNLRMFFPNRQNFSSSHDFLRILSLRFLKFRFPVQKYVFYCHRRPWGSWFHFPTTNGVILGLIIANVAVYLLWQEADYHFMTRNFTISLENIQRGRLHTVITSAFSHRDLEHIISNMIGLYFFGLNIGGSFGPGFLVKLYIAGAIGGSVFHLLHHAYLATQSKGKLMWNRPSQTPALGASGAVNAIILLSIFLSPTSTIYLDFFIPLPAMLMGAFFIGKDILRIIQGDSNISGSAHLGGAAVATMAWIGLRRRF